MLPSMGDGEDDGRGSESTASETRAAEDARTHHLRDFWRWKHPANHWVFVALISLALLYLAWSSDAHLDELVKLVTKLISSMQGAPSPTPPALVPATPVPNPSPEVPMRKQEAEPVIPSPPPAASFPKQGEPRPANKNKSKKWEGISLKSEQSKNIPLSIQIDSSSTEATTAARFLEEKLKSAHYNLVSESDADLLIKIEGATQSYTLSDDDVPSNQVKSWRWSTSIHVIVQFSGNEPIIDRPFDSVRPIPGDLETGADKAMDRAAFDVCTAIFLRCLPN